MAEKLVRRRQFATFKKTFFCSLVVPTLFLKMMDFYQYLALAVKIIEKNYHKEVTLPEDATITELHEALTDKVCDDHLSYREITVCILFHTVQQSDDLRQVF